MAFCSNCGKEIDDNSQFCIFCGCQYSPKNGSSTVVQIESKYDKCGGEDGEVKFGTRCASCGSIPD